MKSTVVVAALVACVSLAAWADKSGVRANVIDLPTGPGSISGLGEQFEPNLNMGSATYGVKFQVPAGTAGFAPSLALHYDSGQGDGPTGVGWALDVGGIQRQTDHGVPQYGAADRFLYNGQELVPVGAGVFRFKNEGAFMRFRQAGSHWEADAPDGTLYRFGVSTGAQVVGAPGTFRWALEQMVDVWGNRILFTYQTDGAQLYLSRIDYNARAGAASNAVTFEYESRTDALTDFRAGFGVTTALRLKRVRMSAQGSAVRRYELGYDISTGLSRLTTVTLYGTDDTTSLPPLTFSYSGFNPAAQAVETVANPPSFSLLDPNTELIDFDGDSLPDLLHTAVGNHHVAYNQGGSWSTAQAIPNSPSVQLATNGVEVADLNGDGIVDLIAKLSQTDFSYFPNKGAGHWETAVAFANPPPFSFEDTTVRLIDFDGDGLIDVMQTTASNYYYWRNNGDGSWGAPITGTPIPDQTILFSDSEVKLADMNGDRLVDLVFVSAGTVRYWPNMGYGHWGAMVTLSGAPNAGADQPRVQLGDLNGDGLADLFLASGTQLQVWLQQPNGTFAAPVVITNLPDANPATTVVREADMNGSGTADIVWNTPSGATPWQFLDLSGGVRPNLLTDIDNGLGKHITIGYSSSGAMFQAAKAQGTPWTSTLPHAVQVVSSVTVTDGRGWQGQTQFDYRDGFYEGVTRQYRGFGRASRTEVGDAQDATSISVHDFDLGRTAEALKGSVLGVQVQAQDGTVLTKDTHGYVLHPYATGLDARPVAGADHLWHETQHVEGTNTPITTREEFTYDDFGDVVVHSEWGVIDGSNYLAGRDERITTTEYANDTNAWLLHKPTHVTTTDAQSNVLSESHDFYDGEPFVGLPLGQLGAQGEVTRTEEWVAGTYFAQVHRVQRNAFGVATATLDALGARHEVDWDVNTNCFPVAERSFLDAQHSLNVQAIYDVPRGVLTSFQDVAGRVTSFDYDALLRVTAIVRPGDSEASPTQQYSYLLGNPLSQVVTKARVAVGGSALQEKHAWVDGLGRSLGTVESAEDRKTLFSGAKVFGARGAVVKDFDPFFGTDFTLPAVPTGTPTTQHVFDAQGRETLTTERDGTQFKTTYLPLATQTQDAEQLNPASPHFGTSHTQRSNGLGVYQLEEKLGTQTVITQWLRDGLGRVASVIDPLGQTATYSFDGLGRAVQSVHPDSGQTTYLFDDEGNLLTRTDARGAHTDAQYDALQRPTQEVLVSAAGATEETIRYHYDAPSPQFPGDAYAVGDLTWVEDSPGQVHFLHDNRGRLTELVRTANSKSYHLGQSYDDLDRLTQVTYPDGRIVEYNYNERNLLSSVPGVLDTAQYNERGLVISRHFTNGVVSSTGYDAMDRLATLNTQAGNKTLQNISLQRDGVGNLLTLQDTLRSSGPLAAARQFSYDDLYRVVSGQSPNQTWNYAYNVGGDFTSKSDVGAYTYGAGHQVAQAGPNAYGYDAAGEVISRPHFTETFDAKGRLAAVSKDDGTHVAFGYNYAGKRMLKQSAGPKGSHTTVYVSPLAEERDGQLVDYVFAGDQRIARFGGQKPAAISLAGLPPALALLSLLAFALSQLTKFGRRLRRQTQRLTALALALAVASFSCGSCGKGADASLIVYHSDFLGGTSFQTDSAGAVAAEVAYSPFGQQLSASSEPYAFTGKEFDEDTGLYDYGAREYDPVLGRFISPDPAATTNPEVGLGESQRLGSYVYALNNPLKFVDPDGHFAHIVAGAALGGVVAFAAYALIQYSNNDPVTLRGSVAAFAGGAVMGGMIAATAGLSLAVGQTIMVGGLSAAEGGLVTRAIAYGPSSREANDITAVATDFAAGAAFTMATISVAAAAKPGALGNARGAALLPGGKGTGGSTIQANKAAGDAWSTAVGEKLKATYEVAVPEITVRTGSGVRTRLDWVTKDSAGTIGCVECKASHSAPLTPNQTAAHPEIGRSGAVVVGEGKPGIPGGTVIPPTTVEVKRP